MKPPANILDQLTAYIERSAQVTPAEARRVAEHMIRTQLMPTITTFKVEKALEIVRKYPDISGTAAHGKEISSIPSEDSALILV